MDQISYTRTKESQHTHWWFKSRREIFKKILDVYLFKKKDLEILDYGAGIGANHEVISHYGMCSAYEPNSKVEKILQKKYKVLKVIKKKYDLIFFTDTLEHVKDDKKLFKFLSSKLKKNGTLFLTVPSYQFLFSSKDRVLHHYRRYNKKDLLLIKPKALKVLKFTSFNTFLFFPISFMLLFFKLFNVDFSDSVERAPNKIFNYILFKIFSFEKKFLPYLDFPFGISQLMVLRKK